MTTTIATTPTVATLTESKAVELWESVRTGLVDVEKAIIETPATGACGCDNRCGYLHTAEGARFRLTYDAAGWDADPRWSLPWVLDVAREVGGEVAHSLFIYYLPTPAAAMDFAYNLPDWAREELAESLGCEVAR